jgi:hypothetical protein
VADEQKGKKDTVKLAFEDWRYSSWDFGVEGVDEIRAEGTEVPADKEKQVREAAQKKGIALKKL